MNLHEPYLYSGWGLSIDSWENKNGQNRGSSPSISQGFRLQAGDAFQCFSVTLYPDPSFDPTPPTPSPPPPPPTPPPGNFSVSGTSSSRTPWTWTHRPPQSGHSPWLRSYAEEHPEGRAVALLQEGAQRGFPKPRLRVPVERNLRMGGGRKGGRRGRGRWRNKGGAGGGGRGGEGEVVKGGGLEKWFWTFSQRVPKYPRFMALGLVKTGIRQFQIPQKSAKK